MRAVLVVVSLAACLLIATTAWSQAPEREMQTGAKTSTGGFATQTDLVIKPAELTTTKDKLLSALQKLTADTVQAGFTPVGTAQVVLVGVMPPSPTGDITLQIQVPVIEQPTADDLAGKAGVKVVKFEAVPVIFTYHKGALEQLQASFMRLFQWMTAAGKEPNGPPVVIICSPTMDDPAKMSAELQIPVK